ncbi:hypothetical protein GZH47_21720 [Paenibacillus rhizovicinus]|uniref:Flagellar hook-associated protein 2 C-terminal domain-containing protein n=1 Tax=Paenibacillus rhizovicinus TaxID=2704463 RepID=A0A6C0P3P8_9BACL|nr:hypothetical protein [Paenibacillus rhizovicinus]QHW33144.1 hypothetical protein GZH47_21720 [Paenibacillus rhizovicinus]
MYPYSYADNYWWWNNRNKGAAKQSHDLKPVRVKVPASLPREARESLQAALEASTAWLEQCVRVRDAVSDFTQRNCALLANRTVGAEGNISGRAENGAPIGQFTVQIDSIARSQRNVSFDVMPFAPSVIAPGVHRMNVYADSFSEVYTIAVRQGESNIAALRKLRDAVNASSLHVRAELETEPSAGIVRVELSAIHSGTEHAFLLEDLDHGKIVKASGIGRVAMPASNAVFAIDGGAAAVSSTNRITAWNDQATLDITFAGIGSTSTVRVEPDLTNLSERLRFLAEGINTLHAIQTDSRGSLEPTLMKPIDEAMTHAGAKTAGIYRLHDGSWQLDEEKLLAAASLRFEDLKRQLTGRNGFAAALGEELRRTASLPTKALINVKSDAFQPFTRYSASSEPYLQLRLSGFHVDDVL